MASIWGGDNPSVAWNENSWASNTITVSLTGLSTTSSVGSITAFPEQGWGGDEWGNDAWGVNYSVLPTGVSATSSVGSVLASQVITPEITGVESTSSVGSLTLNLESIIIPIGQQALTELGDFDNAGTLVGWGRNGWGEEPYGDSFNKLIQLSGLSATSSVGTPVLDLQSVVSLTGVISTSSIGSLGIVVDCTVVPTGLSATSSVGSISPADVMGLTGLSATTSVGSISPADVMGLTGVQADTSIGEVDIVQSPIIYPEGFSNTSSVGSFTIPNMQIGLTGLSTTSSVGAISPDDVVGLTGVQTTSSVNADGLILRYYGKLDPKTSTGYTPETPKTSVSGYSPKTPKTSTGYTTKTP